MVWRGCGCVRVCVQHAERRSGFGVSEGMSADVEWHRRQTANCFPVLISEQEGGEQTSDGACFSRVSAGMHAASGQITTHNALVAIWLSSIPTFWKDLFHYLDPHPVSQKHSGQATLSGNDATTNKLLCVFIFTYYQSSQIMSRPAPGLIFLYLAGSHSINYLHGRAAFVATSKHCYPHGKHGPHPPGWSVITVGLIPQ